MLSGRLAAFAGGIDQCLSLSLSSGTVALRLVHRRCSSDGLRHRSWSQDRIRDRRSGLTQFCNAKVEHLDAITAQTIWLKPDVVGLEITMHDTLLVRFLDRGTNLLENVDDPLHWQTQIGRAS